MKASSHEIKNYLDELRSSLLRVSHFLVMLEKEEMYFEEICWGSVNTTIGRIEVKIKETEEKIKKDERT